MGRILTTHTDKQSETLLLALLGCDITDIINPNVKKMLLSNSNNIRHLPLINQSVYLDACGSSGVRRADEDRVGDLHAVPVVELGGPLADRQR